MRIGLALLIVLLALLLLGWQQPDAGDDGTADPRSATGSEPPSSAVGGAGVEAPATATASTPDPQRRCQEAKSLQAGLGELVARGIAFFSAAQDTLMGDLERWPAQLEGSDDPELLYAASVGPLGADSGSILPAQQIRQVSRALAVDGTNPIYLSSLLTLCVKHPSTEGCELPRLERRLVEADGDNGQSWELIAISCTTRDDSSCAVDAMERAAQATAYRDYYVERVLLAERAMAVAGLSYPLRSTAAFAFASTYLGGLSIRSTPCWTQASMRLDLACRRYGERLEVQGQSLWTQMRGRAMQRRAMKRLGDEDALAALDARHSQANQAIRGQGSDGQIAVTEAVFTQRLIWDRAFFLEYTSHMQRVGEMQARVDVLAGWGTGPADCLTSPPVMDDD